MKLINPVGRTDAIRAMKEGDSILLTPYGELTFQKEASAIKAMATKFGIVLSLKQYLLVAEGEVSRQVFCVTHEGARKSADEPSASLGLALAMLVIFFPDANNQEDVPKLLADKIDATEKEIKSWMERKAKPSDAQYHAIANLTGFDVKWLMGTGPIPSFDQMPEWVRSSGSK